MKKSNSRIHPVDLVVGERVGIRRRLLGLSLSQLARASGISVPQLLKYESGANRISASRLSDIASVLRINVAGFFPTSTFQHHATIPFDPTSLSQTDIHILGDTMRIKDSGVKSSVLELLRAAAQTEKTTKSDGASRRRGRQTTSGAHRAR